MNPPCLQRHRHMPEPYYPINGFRYTFNDIAWALENISLLEAGIWPQRPTSYTNIRIQTSIKPGAKFCGPVEIAAEVTVRLQATGQDGTLAMMYHARGVTIEELGDLLKWDYGRVMRHINAAISFCCGYRRRRESYQDFRLKRRQRYQKVG